MFKLKIVDRIKPVYHNMVFSVTGSTSVYIAVSKGEEYGVFYYSIKENRIGKYLSSYINSEVIHFTEDGSWKILKYHIDDKGK